MSRRQYKGNSVPTSLAAPVGLADTTATLTDGSTFPDGSTGPFVITVDSGLTGEEKWLVTARSGNALSGITRAYDGTTAATHSAAVVNSVKHTLSAVDLDEANAHVNSTTSVHGIADTALLLTTATGVVRSQVQQTLVAAAESTTSVTFADLTTPGPVVTTTVGASGQALVFCQADTTSSTNNTYAIMGVAVSGATTVAAQEVARLRGNAATAEVTAAAFLLIVGLTPGSNTFTAKYQAPLGSSQSFSNRRLLVIPL